MLRDIVRFNKIAILEVENNQDITIGEFLEQKNLVVVVSYNLESIERAGALKLKALQDYARKNNYQIIFDKTDNIVKLMYNDLEISSTKINIKGLMLFSPAIRIKSKGGFLANWHKVISWAFPERAWFDIMDDNDFAKYESFPKNAADQIYLLTKKIDLAKLSSTSLIV